MTEEVFDTYIQLLRKLVTNFLYNKNGVQSDKSVLNMSQFKRMIDMQKKHLLETIELREILTKETSDFTCSSAREKIQEIILPIEEKPKTNS